ncbi:MAG: endonuclease/exonuclease/phosphatase family protein [Anaerolineae bacterium]|nr:endonuclease/exonuclease/phosphatase family protein [Anaerolineae bacterium]
MRIATYNLRHHADRWQERFPLVVDTLLAADADLVGLQEVSLRLGTHNQAEIIVDAMHQKLGRECYQVYFVECRGTQKGNEGVAIVSRVPVLETETIALPGIWRVAIRVTVEMEGRRMGLIDTHLHHEPIFEETIRYPQAQALLAWAQQCNHPQIIVGDFNARPDSTTIGLMKSHYLSAYEQLHGREPGHTWPTPLVDGVKPEEMGMIDYIFYPGADIQVVDCQLIGTDADPADERLYPSDHFGIAAEFVWR